MVEYRADGTTDGCNLNALPDGCTPDALCYQVLSSAGTYYLNYCVGLSHCSEDGGCPNDASGYGAVCNRSLTAATSSPARSGSASPATAPTPATARAATAASSASRAIRSASASKASPEIRCFTYADCFNSPTGCDVTLDGGVDGGEDDGGALGTCY